MLISAALSFLTGAVGRALIGRAIDWIEKRQEHLQEIDRIREQEKIDAAKHTRQMELIAQQASLKIGEIKLVGETQIGVAEANAFAEAMKPQPPTGVRWIDGWNGTIRPATASLCLALWLLTFIRTWFEITDWDRNLIASVLGYYFADRHLGKK